MRDHVSKNVDLRGCLTGLTLFAAVSLSGAPASAADIVIGAGVGSALHEHLARSLCKTVRTAIGGVTCEARNVEGKHATAPLAVITDVENGSIEIGLVAADWVYHAGNGTGPVKFTDIKFGNLRTLFVLHNEPFTVIARRDSGIQSLQNLPGKRVNIGFPGSNARAVMDRVMVANGWTRDSFQLADELAGAETSLALCQNRIQAMVATVAHPDRKVAKTIALCDARIVPVTGGKIDELIAATPYFSATRIPAKTYAGQTAAVKLFGIRVAAVTSADIADDVAYAVVKVVFENLDGFKRGHPALGQLTGKSMMSGAAAPLHPGARRYFREMGLM